MTNEDDEPSRSVFALPGETKAEHQARGQALVDQAKAARRKPKAKGRTPLEEAAERRAAKQRTDTTNTTI